MNIIRLGNEELSWVKALLKQVQVPWQQGRIAQAVGEAIERAEPDPAHSASLDMLEGRG